MFTYQSFYIYMCHYSCPQFLGLIHYRMKREHVIEQGIFFSFLSRICKTASFIALRTKGLRIQHKSAPQKTKQYICATKKVKKRRPKHTQITKPSSGSAVQNLWHQQQRDNSRVFSIGQQKICHNLLEE